MKDSHHEACALFLMDDYSVPKKFKSQVMQLVMQVYDSQGFMHCLIIQSVGGFFQPQRTGMLRSFLEENGRKKSSRTKARMLTSEEY